MSTPSAPHGFFRLHGPLVVSAMVGLGVGLFAPVPWDGATRAALGWDAGVALFLVLTLSRMARARSAEAIRRRAAALDQAGGWVMPLSVVAAAASVAVVLAEAVGGRHGSVETVTAPLLTVALSWAFVHVIFALHYAHGFYGPTDDDRAERGGLIFPGEDEPDYWDFLHFALIIGVANQTADIQISDRRLRQVSTLQSLIAFVFNTVILALTVNLAAGLLG
ncbi:DUF1345 domain-containing protein [Brevundimonas sp.]|uniref:DUF1345 domain-containing protein n=1 Tax=Brevundimonas sp. TaxID=1871086 RepID=UPI0025C0FBD6|nr:DUF1345 domain-containing protein [Brevundimonas sp.]